MLIKFNKSNYIIKNKKVIGAINKLYYKIIKVLKI